MVLFIDEIAAILPTEISLGMIAIDAVTERIHERLGLEGIPLNQRKS